MNLDALHHEIEAAIMDQDGGSASDLAWGIIALVEKRLGPVLTAAQKLRHIDKCGAPVAEFTEASWMYDKAVTKASAL